MTIREFKPNDTGSIVRLFTETVRTVNIHDYTVEQVEAWAPEEADIGKWQDRLQKSITFVAEDNHDIIGFAQLEKDGHIDCFYVHHKFMKKGVGSQLYQTIEHRAKSMHIGRLFTESSITAKPFFLEKGFHIVKEQAVQLRGVNFLNYVMHKSLLAA